MLQSNEFATFSLKRVVMESEEFSCVQTRDERNSAQHKLNENVPIKNSRIILNLHNVFSSE